ncbi:hemagglutinin/amebocyte aggregation factor-like isoform X1 [Mytilus edulis]|uniref:hemagglutinin/amebocyte aggregation factor-like isoform X1 n=1 Tax=Mytilus edulis TaxID=6550 RepID=UPI0039EE9B01
MSTTCVYFLTLTIGTVHGWMNAMDKELNFKCPAGCAVYEINSKHDNFFEDRVFEILCRPTGKSSSGCQWTDYVNSFEQSFEFQCPNQSVMSGMESIHDNTAEDRRWKFYCCAFEAGTLSECQKLPKTHLDYAWSLYAPANFVFRGVASSHDNNYQDRDYTFEICRLG